MSRLSNLYQAMETLAKEGLEWSAEQEAQLRKAEEEIIKKEILFVLTEKIRPILSQIERELVLVVDHMPNMPLKVSISRKRNIADVLTDAVEISFDPEVEHRSNGKCKMVEDKTPKTRLRVVMPDGTTICHPKAKDTFIEALIKIGIDRVRPLGLKCCKIPLISNTWDKKYKKSQHRVVGGWLIITHSATSTKKEYLDKIANMLNLHITTEII